MEGFKVKPANIGIFYKTILLNGLLGILCILGSGCQPEGILSSSSEIAAFDLAGPITPKVDLDQLLRAKSSSGTYTIYQGDVLEIQMPTILTAVSPKNYNDQLQQVGPYMCRVSDTGLITVPILGQIEAQGKTLAQLETDLVGGYYPKYVLERPSVVCGVKEYHYKSVTVVGAVVQPGVFQLKSNEMSLVSALMKAGGIIEGGASVITIKNPQRQYTGTGSANDVKQLAELADSSELDFELAFQPEKSSATKGNLIIEKNSKTLYAKKIDIKNPSQRAKYIKELQTIVGEKQAYIVGQALEQLASQLSPAITASGEKSLDIDDKELIEIAAEGNRTGSPANKSSNIETIQPHPTGNQKYIESTANDKTEAGTSQNVSEVKFVEPAPVESNPPAPAAEFVKPAAAPAESNQPAPSAKFVEPVTTPAENNKPASAAEPVIKPIILPVKGLNIPFADVPLLDGDLIEVKRLTPAVFTVIGLAKTPGSFPYPPDTEYNLMQAIGFAGGLDHIADPRFVTIYRQDAKGDVVSATFRVDKKFMAASYNVKIKPGDVISLDMTARTRRNIVMSQIFRINMGMFVDPFNGH
jgi:protein involved in polysaccharide export with SLBB domain